MSNIVYFVVAVDVDDKSISIDDDTFTARFDRREQVWNTETQEWEADFDDLTYYNSALEILNNNLKIGVE